MTEEKTKEGKKGRAEKGWIGVEEEEEEEEEGEKEIGEKKREEKRERRGDWEGGRKERWEVKDLHLDTTIIYNLLRRKKKQLLTTLLGMSWTMGGWSLTGSMVTVT